MEDARYVDIYLLPVPEARLAEYREQAARFGAAAREHGALSYREFRGDDLDTQFGADAGDGLVLTAAVAEFRSREERDAIMAKVMADPRVTAMAEAEAIPDMSRMRYGGFELLVSA